MNFVKLNNNTIVKVLLFLKKNEKYFLIELINELFIF